MTATVHLLRSTQPCAERQVAHAARHRGRQGSPPWGRSRTSQVCRLTARTWRLLNAEPVQPRAARCTLERRMRAVAVTGGGPGRGMRTTRPAACSRVPQGTCARRDLDRLAPKPAVGGRLHLRPDMVGVGLHGLRHGPVLPPGRRLGHQQPRAAPTSCPVALEQAVRQPTGTARAGA